MLPWTMVPGQDPAPPFSPKAEPPSKFVFLRTQPPHACIGPRPTFPLARVSSARTLGEGDTLQTVRGLALSSAHAGWPVASTFLLQQEK